MTMPASAFSRTVRYATAGVGIVPNGITSPPGGADTGHQRRLEHIGGNTRVLTDGDRQSVLFLLRQNRRQRAANLKGEVDRQIFADDARGFRPFQTVYP